VLIAQAVALTFTRAGLITMAASLALVGAWRYRARGRDRGVVALAALTVTIGTLFFASRSAQSLWLRFTSEGQESWYRADVVAPADIWMADDEVASIPVTLINTGRIEWDSDANPPFYVSYHWLDADADRIVAFQGLRTAFEAPVSPGSRVSLAVQVRSPAQPGEYRLVWDIVQEGRLWFTTEAGAIPVMSRAIVGGDQPRTALATFAPPRPTVRPRRFQLWRAAWRMVAARPLVGVGPDNFRLSYAPYAGLAAGDPRIHSNNMYLEMLAGAGISGALAFAWLLWSVARVTRPTAADPASLAIAAAALAIAVHGAVDSFLSFAPTYVLFAMTVGFAHANSQFSEQLFGTLRVASSEVERRPQVHAYRV
jgi:O-Antigen ligase